MIVPIRSLGLGALGLTRARGLSTLQPLCPALLVLVCALSVARADPSGGVSLRVDPCVAADPALVDQLFRVELRTSLADSDTADSLAGTRVEIGCADDLVEITVHDPITGKSLTRRISPGQPAGRERLLALAAMELLVASWVELATTPEPVVPGVDSTAPVTARQKARSAVRRRFPTLAQAPAWSTTVELLGAAQLGGELQLGGGARLVRDHRRGFGWSVDVVATRGRASVTLGEVTLGSVGASAGFHATGQRGVWRWRAGGGGRMTLVQMAGDSERGDVLGRHLTGFAGGPLVRGELQVEPVADLALGLAVESGYNLLAVRGQVDGAAGTSVDGPWLGLQLGGGWSW